MQVRAARQRLLAVTTVLPVMTPTVRYYMQRGHRQFSSVRAFRQHSCTVSKKPNVPDVKGQGYRYGCVEEDLILI
jgi:hypothetical protein